MHRAFAGFSSLWPGPSELKQKAVLIWVGEKLGLWVRRVVLRRLGEDAEAAGRNRKAGHGREPLDVRVFVCM